MIVELSGFGAYSHSNGVTVINKEVINLNFSRPCEKCGLSGLLVISVKLTMIALQGK